MSKRRRSYSTRRRDDRLSDEGIAAYSGEDAHDGLLMLNTPLRRLVFFAGLAGILALVIATAVMT